MLDGRFRLPVAAPEPELTQASHAALLPVGARQGAIGVLEVWQEQQKAPFDARMMRLLETLAFLAAIVVENERLRTTVLDSERLKRDVEIGSRIQQTLLLGSIPLDLKLIRAAAASIPSWQIDGDFYDFFAYEQTLDVVVGDVMGKGIPAAVIGAATKNHILRAANCLLSSGSGRLPRPKEILAIVNAELIKQLIGIESFVTLCYARFDVRQHQLELIDCGHTRVIHSRPRLGTYALLAGENMPLGFSPGEVYKPVAVPFTSGDVFFLYSDGITEAQSPSGEFYGEERLARLIHSQNHLDPQELVALVRKEVLAFVGSAPIRDDLTCVAVKIQDTQATAASRAYELEITSDLKELARVRTFLREACAESLDLRLVEADLAKLELAVTEAVSNVIIHAYHRQPDSQIRIEVEVYLIRVSVRIYHRGQPFDPDTIAVPPLEGPREGQMGLHIIRECVDQVKYSRARHGENCIHLVKNLIPRLPQGQG
jgi:sigma-B regulation protein RsbU (phosphoserine phosphatase)